MTRVGSGFGHGVPLLLALLALSAVRQRIGVDAAAPAFQGVACLDTCDQSGVAALPPPVDGVPNTTSSLVTFCGTDGLTYTRNPAGIIFDRCYFKTCGLGSQYAGPCGCPNNCNSNACQGTCNSQTGKCECSAGWTGPDCSWIACPNACGGHGKCIRSTSKSADRAAFAGMDYCKCDSGWQGYDCSSPVAAAGTRLPYGQLLQPAQVSNGANFGSAYATDSFEDNHPAFNLSVFATIQITLDTNDWLWLQTPTNIDNTAFYKASVRFDNGALSQAFPSVGFRKADGWSRYMFKADYLLSLGEFDKTLGLGTGSGRVQRIGLKGPEEAQLIKNQFWADFQRAAGVPTQRSSFALVFINGVFWGPYWMYEEVNRDFVRSRFTDGNGPLLNVIGSGWFQWQGTNPWEYPNNQYAIVSEVTPGTALAQYMQFVTWVKQASDADFAAGIEAKFNVDNYLRTIALETLFASTENYLYFGGNYRIYMAEGKWHMFDYDFDGALTGIAYLDQFWPFILNVTDQVTGLRITAPLHARLFAIQKYRDQLLDVMRPLLRVFRDGSGVALSADGATPANPHDLWSAYSDAIVPWLRRDELYLASTGVPRDQLVSVITTPNEVMQTRAFTLLQQIGDGTTRAAPDMPQTCSTFAECGPTGNGRSCCPGYCCSQWGFCGISPDHCSVASGCQTGFSQCVYLPGLKAANCFVNNSAIVDTGDDTPSSTLVASSAASSFASLVTITAVVGLAVACVAGRAL